MTHRKKLFYFIVIPFLLVSCQENKIIDGSNFIYNGKVKRVTTLYYEIEKGDTTQLNTADTLRRYINDEKFDIIGNTISQTFTTSNFKTTDEYKYENGQLLYINETWENDKISRSYLSTIKWKDKTSYRGTNYDSLTKIMSFLEIVFNKDKSKKSKLVYSIFKTDTISRSLFVYNSTSDTNRYCHYTKKNDRDQVDTTFFITKAVDKHRNALRLIEIENGKPLYYLIREISYY